MKTKLLGIALLFSLGFNLFFLTGYFKARHALTQTKTLQQRVEAAGKQLGLDPDQQNRLMEIFRTTQKKQKILKQKQHRLTQEFMKEFRKNNPDTRYLKSKLRALKQEQRQLQQFAKKEWKGFLIRLTPTQHDAVTRLLKRRPDLYRKLLLKSVR